MKNLLLLFTVVLCFSLTAQDFTWVKGSNTGSVTGIYGTQGVSAPGNNPGSRHGCAKWTDNAGNLWLFGGEGPGLSWWSDLWKYNITTNEWTWMKGPNAPNLAGNYGTLGVAAASNEPSAREFASSWVDAAGNFWMFGGDGFVASAPTQTLAERLGDLWKYNPSTNEWTWMHGFTTSGQSGIYGTLGIAAPANAPGGRYGSGMWTDPAGDLWLFGGRGVPTTTLQGYLNDLWKFTISTNQWTWVSGSNTGSQNGIYGSQGVGSATNIPGGRYFPASWTDNAGVFYMMGGYGFPVATYTSGSVGYQNDLWKFDPVTLTWTWLNGSSGLSVYSNYGTQNVSSPANIVGGRYSSATWKDDFGNLWLFGGYGLSSAVYAGSLNDLFKYTPSTNEWTWVKGSTVTDQNGTYGTQGVSAPLNIPGGREYNTFWKGKYNKYWLFGGEGFDISSINELHMNDLWSFTIPCNPDSITVSPSKFVCSGTSVTLTAVNSGPGTNYWATSLTTPTSVASGTVLSLTSLTTSATQTVISYYATANSCTSIPRTVVNITVNPLPTLAASASQTLVCQFLPSTLTVSGANSYTWNTVPVNTGSTLVFSSGIMKNHILTIVGVDLNGCQSTTSVSVRVTECIGIKENTVQNLSYSLYPNPNKGLFVLNIESEFKEAQIQFINALGQKVFQQKIQAGENLIKPELPGGIYFYQLVIDSAKSASGKLIIEN